ncbi:type II secretion system protein GspG [Candidatus Sumerlaeota bacterium]|nr:type II secretion system protein GspG [Candidatus Sumerlaeota bacterium]
MPFLRDTNGHRSKGVSLFELLIVVTVILVLAILFLISYPHFIISTKISRVKEEQMVLVRALTNYHLDYGKFPTTFKGLTALSAPTAYLGSVPCDPFSEEKNHHYFYLANLSNDIAYIIISLGPDGDNDLLNLINNNSQSTPPNLSCDELNTSIKDCIKYYLQTKIYDPTNGIKSDGDLVYIGKK